MVHAWIAGEPVTIDDGIAEAARLLAASRQPLIAGLGTDVAGARAAATLAKQLGAIVDHMHADVLLRNLEVMRSSGVLLTTCSEASVRADIVLLIGPGLDGAWLQLPGRLFEPRRNSGGPNIERRIYCLCPARDLKIASLEKITTVTVGKRRDELSPLLAALRARVAGRPIGKAGVSSKKLDEVAAALKEARYGVAIWSAAVLDALTIEMVCGLVDDLNATTRFAGLPLAPDDNAVGVMQTCAWMTGAPMRSRLGPGLPQHDPWLFDSRRLVATGEVDCVVWISAYRAATAEWRGTPAVIALTAGQADFAAPPRVHIEIGRPGIDHDGVAYLPSIGTLGLVEAREPSSLISAADAISRIAVSLLGAGDRAC
jgi:formylmethanofuran dehydrogenase subunit B